MTTRSRRPLQWYDTELEFATLAVGGQTNLLLYNAVSLGARNIKGATVTRMLLDFDLRSDSLAQLNRLRWGIVMMNADARAAGAFPDPGDPSDRAGWLARGRMNNMMTSQDASQWTTRHHDLRSQRIFHTEEDELHLILDNNGGFILSFSAYIRLLVRLP